MQALVDFLAPRGPIDWVRKVVFIIIVVHILNLMIVPRIAPDNWSLRVELIKATIIPLPLVILGLAIISYLDELQRKLTKIATTDVLTGLANRRAFFDQAESAALRNGGTALMLDVDHFKRINDTYGHDIGDRCLRVVAERLVDELRNDDVAGRIGGEEFAVLMMTGDRGVIAEFANALTKGIQVSPEEGYDIWLTLSMGASFTDPGEGIGAALSRADSALYRAKREGRARLVYWNADIDRRTGQRTRGRRVVSTSGNAA